jgi:hypothetical protein
VTLFGTKVLACPNDANLLEDNIGTVNGRTETVFEPSTEVGLEVNVGKAKYMLVSRDQNGFLTRQPPEGRGFPRN